MVHNVWNHFANYYDYVVVHIVDIVHFDDIDLMEHNQIENMVELLQFIEILKETTIIDLDENRVKINMSKSRFHGYLCRVNAMYKWNQICQEKINDLKQRIEASECLMSQYHEKSESPENDGTNSDSHLSLLLLLFSVFSKNNATYIDSSTH